MAIALVNSTMENVTGTSTSKSITIPATTAGNTLVVALATWGVSTNTLSDNKSGGSSTYISDDVNLKNKYWDGYIQVFYLTNCAAGITQITGNFSASIQSSIWVGEYSGVLSSGALDAAASSARDYTTTFTSPTVTTTVAGDLIIGAFSVDGANIVPTAINGFTVRINQPINSGNQAFFVLDKIGTAAGSETPSADVSYSTRCGCVTLALKPAPSAPAASAVITEQNLPSNHNGNITVHAVGTNTNWTSSTTWTPSGVSGWSVASKTCNSATSYTIVLTPATAASPPNGATGTLTLTEGVTGSVAATTTVATPTLSLSPSSGATGTTPSVTLTGTNTLWSSETAATLFTKTGGSGASIGSISVASNTSATATITTGSSNGGLTITDASTGATATFTVTLASAAITEQNLPSNHNGNITVHAVGTNTAWTSSTTWTASGVSGWSVASKTYVSPTSYTIVLTPPANASPPAGSTGTLTLTEGVTGSIAATTTIGTPTLALSVTSGAANGTQSLTFTGSKTLWSGETASTLFTVSGGTGASIGTISVGSNTSATAVLTKGSAAGTLTITDSSTGATATFTVNAVAATGVVVFLGNSTTYGSGITYGDPTYPSTVMDALNAANSGRTGYVVAEASATIARMQQIFFDANGGAQNSHYSAGNDNVVVILGGGSDLSTHTGAETWSYMQTFVTAAKAAGWRVVIASAAVNPGATYETNRKAYHALVDANWYGFADGYAAWHTDSRVGPCATGANTTYYQDYNHPTSAGAQVYAEYVLLALESLGVYTPTTSVDLSGYVLKTDVVSASYVVAGHDNYVGGSAGTYPTTAATQAAQLATDTAAVNAVKAKLQNDTTVLSVTGTLDLSTYTLKSSVVSAAYVVTGNSNYVGGSAGTYPTTAMSQAAQLATDQAAVDAVKAKIQNDTIVLGVTGTFDLSTYTLKSGVVAASYVVTGNNNYAGGAAGTYPTTATSQAAQLATDQAAVNAVKSTISSATTVLGVTGTLDLSQYVLKTDVVAAANVVTGNSNYVGGSAGTYPTSATTSAAQLATDTAAVNASKAKIQNDTIILGVTGTLDLSTYVLKSNVVSASYVVTGNSNYVGGTAGTYPTTATSQAAQLATDQAAVNAVKTKLQNDTTVLGVTGTLDLSTYVLKTDVVAASNVVTGYSNYVGGSAGTYPTTAVSQAAQFTTDAAAVEAKRGKIVNDTTILGVTGTLDLSLTNDVVLKADVVSAAYVVVGHENYLGGSAGTYPTSATSQAEQLATDTAAVNAKKNKIVNDTTILGVTGTLDLATSGGGGSSGTGARTVTVTVNDGTTPLESATVRLTKGALTHTNSSDVSGQCTFNVDDGTWTVAITLAGYAFDGATLVVDGDESPTYLLTRYAIATAAAPNLTTGYVLCLGTDGLPEARVTISAQMTAGPGVDGYALDTETIAMVSDADGIAQHTGFVCGASYKFRRGSSAWWTAAQVAPNATTWNLREILGSP